MTDNFDWVEEQEKKNAENRSADYFNIEEGENKFVLLSHCAPLTQVFDPSTKKYRVAEEGDKNVSIKGVCWVMQDEVIKQAKLPYTVVKAIKGYRDHEDWDFKIPFLHPFTLVAKNAGTKEVEYTLNASPKQVEIPQHILDELAKKPTPEEIIEKIKGRSDEEPKAADYPEPEDEGLSSEDIPFDDDSF